MDKIAIIKIGALGDVVRTTSLLHALKGEITWMTKRNAFPLLKDNPLITQMLDIREAEEAVGKVRYDLVINLDEETGACALASKLNKSHLIGAYEDKDGKLTYTDPSAEWFDMGLISRFGKKAADERKWHNHKSYQEMMFAMAGHKFNGEEYMVPSRPAKPKKPGTPPLVGIESRSGDRWAGKRWSRFQEFMDDLKVNHMPYLKFRDFPTLQLFIKEINKTDLVVTTDSLALHIALGLKKKVVALFTCTSFHEIYGYGRMEKVVSPAIKDFFYSTDPELKSGESIEPAKVMEALMKLRKSGN